MEHFDRYDLDYDGDNTPECRCTHCTSEGYYDQTPDCRHYRRPVADDVPEINWARRQVS